MTDMVVTLLELLWPQQRVDEIDHEPCRNEARERIVKDNECLLRAGRRCRRSQSKPRRRRPQGPAGSCPTSECSFPHILPVEQARAALELDTAQPVHATLKRR